jgi:hypothetical protein
MLALSAVAAAILAAAGWGALALWFQSPFGGRAQWFLPVAWLMLAAAAVAGLARGSFAAAWLFCAALALLIAWWAILVRASNDREWMPEVARLTRGMLNGDIVTLTNVRDFAWRSATDYDARWDTRTYDLSRLESVDLVLSYWGRPEVAHSMVSFGFGEARFVVFSVEIRRKLGDRFSEIGGFFRRYELSVLASTEEDSLRTRTEVRGEDGYLYRINMPVDAARALFLSYVKTASELTDRPRFYNTLTANCTTIVYRLARQIVSGLTIDYRLLLSGYLPEYLYGIDALSGADSAEAYRRGGRYTERAHASTDPARFSVDIRRGVPGIGASETVPPMPSQG